MKTIRIAVRNIVLIAFSLLVILSATPVLASAATGQDDRFSKEELEQMLAPIALYPDSLLAQVLMASTYPLEIVEAERWLRMNKGLEGDALYSALPEKDWDTSVKSLCNFPDVLFALSDRIEQTRRLGDAFLSQEEDVMNTVQELRNRAHENGNLKTTKEQKVVFESRIIRIEPAISNVVYVPIYNPLFVYGAWRYTSHKPYYWYYPDSFAFRTTYVFFDPPVFISIGWFSWTWFDWPVFRIYIVINDAGRYHRHFVCRDDDSYWHHDPYHRRGVNYRDRETRERFEQNPPDLIRKGSEKGDYASGKAADTSHSGIEYNRVKESQLAKKEKENSHPDASEKTSPAIAKEKSGVFYPRVERDNKDTESRRTDPDRENTQTSPSKEKFADRSLTGKIEGALKNKSGDREKDRSYPGETKLSLGRKIEWASDVTQGSEISSERGISERGKGGEVFQKDRGCRE